jgi:LmbE family N-acetylglucosaminyl deacetylase
MFADVKKALVLAPHTDDGELGMGGTINKLIDAGIEVYYAAFSICEESVPPGYSKDALKHECINATRILGIKPDNLIIFNHKVRHFNFARQDILDKLVELRKNIEPDIVFMPSLNDVHQDHSTLSKEALRVFKGVKLLAYELIWNNIDFNTACFVKLSKDNISSKINALAEYKTQSDRDYVSEEFIKSHAITRGIQISTRYAECFEVVRWIIK